MLIKKILKEILKAKEEPTEITEDFFDTPLKCESMTMEEKKKNLDLIYTSIQDQIKEI